VPSRVFSRLVNFTLSLRLEIALLYLSTCRTRRAKTWISTFQGSGEFSLRKDVFRLGLLCSSEVSLGFRSSYQGQEACEDALGMEKLVSDRRVVFIEVFPSCASLALHQRSVLRWLCKIRVCISRSIKRVVFHFWSHDQFTSSRDFESREIGKPRARFLQ
jgi:hypothetical protein